VPRATPPRHLAWHAARHTPLQGYVDWLYLDDTLRVTRGSKGSLFVHVRDDDAWL
jgi:hypothetical protein